MLLYFCKFIFIVLAISAPEDGLLLKTFGRLDSYINVDKKVRFILYR